nr:hypothetical protein [Tanacetum cinerariifolium]
TMGTHDDEAGSSRSKRSRQHETAEEVLLPQVHHEFFLWEGCNRDAKSILEGKVNENALADTGSDINTMPYRIYETLGREEIKKVDRGITMINHTQEKAMGMLTNVLCQVGVTTIIAKFLILDIPIDVMHQ